MLLLLACTGPKDEAQESPADDTAESAGDTGGETGSCGEGTAPVVSPTSWEEVGLVPGGGIHTFAAAEGVVYAGSHNAGMWASYDGAATWNRSAVLITHTLADLVLSPDDPDVVYRSSGGQLQRSDDGGDTWHDLDLGRIEEGNVEEVWAVAVAPYDPERVYGVTDLGLAYVSDDRGETFTPAGAIPVSLSTPGEDPFDDHAWHLLADPTADGRLVFTDGGGVYTSDDGMLSWQLRYASPLGGHSLRRDPSDPDHLVLGATDGLVESHDGGETWTLRKIATGLRLASFAPDASWLALVSDDLLYVSDDGGATFTSAAHGWAHVEAVEVIDGGSVLLSWLDGVALSADRGASWADSSTGILDEGMSIVAPDPACPNVVYTGSRCSGGLFRSVDWGASWSHVDHYFHYVMGLHFDPTNPAHVWGVTDESLLESDDGGLTWRDAYVRYHFHGFGIDPLNPENLLLGSVGSGEWRDTSMHVYRSEDGGGTWSTSSTGLPTSEASAHTIAYWPGDSSVVLLGTYKGGDASHQSGQGLGVFRSTDGGASWTATSLAARDIAWLAETPTGVAAATEDGLWTTVDGGESWTQAAGPTGILLSADFEGQVGLALAQSGSAWKTTDGGATWARLDTGLASNPTTWLAQVAISSDATMAWATVYERGVYRIGL